MLAGITEGRCSGCEKGTCITRWSKCPSEALKKAEAENAEWLKLTGNVPPKLIDPEKFGHLVNENDALRERVKKFEAEEARRRERCNASVRDTMRKLHGE